MALTIRQRFAPVGNPNRPAFPMQPRFITVHETGDPRSNAAAEAAFVANGGGDEGVSFHWVVDDHEAIQLLPMNESAFHAADGDGPGNRASIAIETCVNTDGDFEKAKANLADLVAKLIVEQGIPLARVVQHNRWSGKNCPERMRANNNAGWNALLVQVQARLKPLPMDDASILERAFQANEERLGNKLFAGLLRRRDWGGGAVDHYMALVCQRGVLIAVNGVALDVTARCIDDFVVFNQESGKLQRF